MTSAREHPAPAAPARPALAPSLRLVHVTTIPMTLAFLRGQAARLARSGIAVHAISSPGPELDAFGAAEGVPVTGVEMARAITPARDAGAVVRLARALRAIRPDVVDAHTPKAGLLAMAAATLVGVPARVYHLHGLRFVTERGWRRAVLRLAEQAACALAHRVIAVSPSVREIAVTERVCRARRIVVLLGGTVNGVDAARFAPREPGARGAARARLGIPERALVVGFVGRLARDKGIAELAGAWATLRGDAALHLVVVGPEDAADPPPAAALAALRADPRVHLLGFAGDVAPLYAAMDVVALPSYREGFPQIALEAGAAGLPVVASAVSGCVDAVRDGVTGRLVPARSAPALAAALRAYLDDPAARRAHGEAARRRVVAEFDRAAVCDALAAELHGLLPRGAGRVPAQAPA